MNKPRLNELAGLIESRKPFDMGDWCGCIAGLACRRWAGDRIGAPAIFAGAQKALDLSDDEADQLFCFPRLGRIPDRAEAARACRRLAAGWPAGDVWRARPRRVSGVDAMLAATMAALVAFAAIRLAVWYEANDQIGHLREIFDRPPR